MKRNKPDYSLVSCLVIGQIIVRSEVLEIYDLTRAPRPKSIKIQDAPLRRFKTKHDTASGEEQRRGLDRGRKDVTDSGASLRGT